MRSWAVEGLLNAQIGDARERTQLLHQHGSQLVIGVDIAAPRSVWSIVQEVRSSGSG